MTAAIFGLLGVIVGGVLNGLIQAAAAWRVRLGQTRVAVRLIENELDLAVTYIRLLKKDGAIGPPTPICTLDGWVAQQAVLALVLSTEDWLTVLDAVRRVSLVYDSSREAPLGAPVPAGHDEMLNDALKSCEAAVRLLQPRL